jgi:hypothetical protein
MRDATKRHAFEQLSTIEDGELLAVMKSASTGPEHASAWRLSRIDAMHKPEFAGIGREYDVLVQRSEKYMATHWRTYGTM